MNSTANQTNSNPLCPACGILTYKNGRTVAGSACYRCRRCRKHFTPLKQTRQTTACKCNLHPRCPTCGGSSQKRGRTATGSTPRYSCRDCQRWFVDRRCSRKASSNPPCRSCGGSTQKRGQSANGRRMYCCRVCKRYFTLSLQQQRQHKVSKQAEQLPALIAGKVPKNLPIEIREELQQELVVAALAGEFDLSELDQVITRYRRKVYRESLTGFAYVSLDAVIPQTNGLTYADTLAG